MRDAPSAGQPAGAAELSSVIAPGAEFHGLVVVHGSACIEGRLVGEVVGAELLRIGEQGWVEARIQAAEVWVAGRLQGEIRAERRVELAPTARVNGRIETPRLRMHEGALFEGRCQVGPAGARPPASSVEAAARPS